MSPPTAQTQIPESPTSGTSTHFLASEKDEAMVPASICPMLDKRAPHHTAEPEVPMELLSFAIGPSNRLSMSCREGWVMQLRHFNLQRSMLGTFFFASIVSKASPLAHPLFMTTQPSPAGTSGWRADDTCNRFRNTQWLSPSGPSLVAIALHRQ